MALLDRETCGLCGGEKLSLGVKTKIKMEPLFICPTCDPHLVKTARRRQGD